MHKDTERPSHCSFHLSGSLNEGNMTQAIERDLDIIAVLKEGTRRQHEAIERIMPFFRNDFSSEDYIRVIKAFLGFFEPVERELASIPTWHLSGLDLDQRLRSNLLRDDLLSLGVSTSDIAVIPRCADLPNLASIDEGFGCLYVLEGSTLGGQLIARQVQTLVTTSKETGAMFFQGYGSQTGAMWRDFCSNLRSHAHSSKNQTAILAAAESTFKKLETWMRKAGFSE
jgi:heme oxygenase